MCVCVCVCPFNSAILGTTRVLLNSTCCCCSCRWKQEVGHRRRQLELNGNSSDAKWAPKQTSCSSVHDVIMEDMDAEATHSRGSPSSSGSLEPPSDKAGTSPLVPKAAGDALATADKAHKKPGPGPGHATPAFPHKPAPRASFPSISSRKSFSMMDEEMKLARRQHSEPLAITRNNTLPRAPPVSARDPFSRPKRDTDLPPASSSSATAGAGAGAGVAFTDDAKEGDASNVRRQYAMGLATILVEKGLSASDVFATLDVHRNNHITAETFFVSCRIVGLKDVTRRQCDVLFRSLDAGKRGQLSHDEFVSITADLD